MPWSPIDALAVRGLGLELISEMDRVLVKMPCTRRGEMMLDDSTPIRDAK